MRFDDRSNNFYLHVSEVFSKEFEHRINNIYELIIRMHPIVQDCECRQLCIKGMRINTNMSLKVGKWELFREGMHEIHININETNCYTIYTDGTFMMIEHRYFKSWENDTRTLLFFNFNEHDVTVVECDLELVYPVLYALDKLEAMY